MARIDVILPDDLEQEFRAEVARVLGMRRGNLKMAVEEAIREWIKSRRQGRGEIAKKTLEHGKRGHAEHRPRAPPRTQSRGYQARDENKRAC